MARNTLYIDTGPVIAPALERAERIKSLRNSNRINQLRLQDYPEDRAHTKKLRVQAETDRNRRHRKEDRLQKYTEEDRARRNRAEDRHAALTMGIPLFQNVTTAEEWNAVVDKLIQLNPTVADDIQGMLDTYPPNTPPEIIGKVRDSLLLGAEQAKMRYEKELLGIKHTNTLAEIKARGDDTRKTNSELWPQGRQSYGYQRNQGLTPSSAVQLDGKITDRYYDQYLNSFLMPDPKYSDPYDKDTPWIPDPSKGTPLSLEEYREQEMQRYQGMFGPPNGGLGTSTQKAGGDQQKGLGARTGKKSKQIEKYARRIHSGTLDTGSKEFEKIWNDLTKKEKMELVQLGKKYKSSKSTFSLGKRQ